MDELISISKEVAMEPEGLASWMNYLDKVIRMVRVHHTLGDAMRSRIQGELKDSDRAAFWTHLENAARDGTLTAQSFRLMGLLGSPPPQVAADLADLFQPPAREPVIAAPLAPEKVAEATDPISSGTSA